METDIKAIIRDIVQKYSEEEVSMDDNLLGWKHKIDSLDTIEIVINIESHFGIYIRDQDWDVLLNGNKVLYIDNLVEMVEKYIKTT